MPTKDTEVAERLGIPAWLLDEMELSAVRRSIAEEVFAELFGRPRKPCPERMALRRLARALKEVQ